MRKSVWRRALPAALLAGSAAAFIPGCGNGDDFGTDRKVYADDLDPGLAPMMRQTRDAVNGLNVAQHFGKLGRNPAPEIARYRNCTVRFTQGEARMNRGRFSGRVLIQLHKDSKTRKNYYRHFREAFFYCNNATLFVRDGGKFVHRIYMDGDVLYYADTPAWSPRVSNAVYFVDSDRYETWNRKPLHRYDVTKPLNMQTGGGHGSGQPGSLE